MEAPALTLAIVLGATAKLRNEAAAESRAETLRSCDAPEPVKRMGQPGGGPSAVVTAFAAEEEVFRLLLQLLDLRLEHCRVRIDCATIRRLEQ